VTYRLFAGIVTLLLLCGGLLSILVNSSSAHAHATNTATSFAKQTFPSQCLQSSCDHTDPYTSGCAGGKASWRVVDTAFLKDPTSGAPLGYIQLWWSDTCQTNWARYVCTQVPQSSCPTMYYMLVSADGRQEANNDAGGVTKQLYLPSTRAQATVDLNGIPAFYAQTGSL
jgi:hypothetical protein